MQNNLKISYHHHHVLYCATTWCQNTYSYSNKKQIFHTFLSSFCFRLWIIRISLFFYICNELLRLLRQSIAAFHWAEQVLSSLKYNLHLIKRCRQWRYSARVCEIDLNDELLGFKSYHIPSKGNTALIKFIFFITILGCYY